MPQRYPVPPPDLSRNTPVLDVLHPVKVDFSPPFRIKFYLPPFYRLDSRFCKRLHPDKPLLGKIRLNNRVTAVTVASGQLMWFYFFKQFSFFQILKYNFSCLKPVHACIVTRVLIQPGIRIEDIYILQLMLFA